MAGVPIEGIPPPPDQKQGGGVGGIFSALLGAKHAENRRKEDREAEYLLQELYDVSRGVTDPPPEYMKMLIQRTGKVFGQDMGAQFKQHFEQHEAAKGLERRKKLLPQQPGAPATPAMPAPAAPPNASRGATAGGGIPLPPFESGAEAGPAPQQPNPAAEMKVGSQLGTQGFGGPQAQPLPEPSQGNFFRRGPVERGVDAAAFAGPGLEQTNRLALGNRAAEHQQDTQWDQEKAARLTQALQSLPGFNELPNFQKQEMLMRAMGIQGAIAAPVKPMNLPASAIHGSEFPADALTVDGKPLDREGWYRQQLDSTTCQFSVYSVQPRLTNTAVTTANGKFLVSRDPRGEIVKVIDSIRGNQIVDPAMLETVRHTLIQRETVDTAGNQVTVMDPVTSSSGKVVPGQRPPSAAPGLPAPPGAQPPASGAPPPRASNIPPPRPKPLTAATRGAAEFAQTIQPEIPRIKAMVADLNAKGKLGVVASRWSDFLAGRVGSEPEYAPLRNAVGLLNTALGRVHGGAKGGGSTSMLEHFGAMQNTGKMDAATLLAALNETGIWIDHYARMGSNRPGAVNMTPPPALTPPPGAAPKSAADYLKSIGH